ncbi:hypothetical protein [Hydrococcus rivularis]|uniref:hypothetical protein n=1 Tax=Hydrococcus rivularis TaxID=1616834 RepID=UPI000A578576|nr:hypothetical protein [Hydrococcus rivularis]
MQSQFGSILDFVRSRSHLSSVGVYLDTEPLADVQLYQHFVYGITAKTRLDNIDIWCMFRLNEEGHRRANSDAGSDRQPSNIERGYRLSIYLVNNT